MNIVIVGGTQGLGRAIAEIYLALGHDVCVCGRDSKKLNGWHYYGNENLDSFQLDITISDELDSLFKYHQDKPIDLLINCAGIYINNRATTLTKSESLQLVNCNVLALNKLLSLTSEKMLAQGYGHIVALSSVAALIHYPGASLYSATKRSVLDLCNTYRTALADFGIKVTAVVPGYINTAQLRHLNGGDASKKLFIVEEYYAASLIVDRLARGEQRIIFPKRMHLLMSFLSFIPDKVLEFFLVTKK